MNDLCIYLPVKGQNTTECREQKGREVCCYSCPETKIKMKM